MVGKVFDRIEKKYLVTTKERLELLKFIKKKMVKDQYHKTEVLNIYFDNDNYDMISESIDWVDFKYKMRARSYGGYDRVFLEIKTKVYGEDEENYGYKRRVMITKKDFEKLVSGEATATELASKVIETRNDLQIAKEVDYLISHFQLKPKILVTYHRESYRDDGGLRITFDTNIKYRTNNLCFSKEKHDKIYFEDRKTGIMEIKVSNEIPLWLVKKMSEMKIYPQRFSKIGKIYERIK